MGEQIPTFQTQAALVLLHCRESGGHFVFSTTMSRARAINLLPFFAFLTTSSLDKTLKNWALSLHAWEGGVVRRNPDELWIDTDLDPFLWMLFCMPVLAILTDERRSMQLPSSPNVVLLFGSVEKACTLIILRSLQLLD